MKKILQVILLGSVLLTAGCNSIPNVENLSMRRTIKYNNKLILDDAEEKEFLELFYKKYKKTDTISPTILSGLTSSYTINYKVKDELVGIVVFESNFGIITKNGESENVEFDEGVYEALNSYFEDFEAKKGNTLTNSTTHTLFE